MRVFIPACAAMTHDDFNILIAFDYRTVRYHTLVFLSSQENRYDHALYDFIEDSRHYIDSTVYLYGTVRYRTVQYGNVRYCTGTVQSTVRYLI